MGCERCRSKASMQPSKRRGAPRKGGGCLGIGGGHGTQPADSAALEALPGIGPILARRIVRSTSMRGLQACQTCAWFGASILD